MPFDWELDPDSRLVRMRGWSRLTVAEIADGLERLFADPRFRRGTPQLVDLRHVEETDADHQKMSSLASSGASLGERLEGRVAVVADRPVVFGISRMYEALTDGLPIDVRTFRDYGEACSWLGVEPRE